MNELALEGGVEFAGEGEEVRKSLINQGSVSP
jgi:hypothetical protein